MKTNRKALFCTVLLCISLVTGVALSEIAIRLIMPGMHIPQREYDPYLGWRGRPNLHCILKERHFTIAISQNSRGFRDRERNVARKTGEFRILCLGDSYTWGWGVQQDQIFTHQMEHLLASQGILCDVINAGVGGYSTDQELLYLEKEGQAYAPDIVVLQVCKNDITDGNTKSVSEGVYQKPFFVLHKDGTLTITNTPVPAPRGKHWLLYKLSRHSRLLYLLKHRVHVRLLWLPSRHTTNELPRDRDYAEGKVDYAFELFCALVARLNQRCREIGARLIVLVDFLFSHEERQYWNSRCSEVNTCFLYDYLMHKQIACGEDAWIPNDGHWSASGHKWLAEYLCNEVSRMIESTRSQQAAAHVREARGGPLAGAP